MKPLKHEKNAKQPLSFWKGMVGGVIGSVLIMTLVVATLFNHFGRPQSQTTAFSQEANQMPKSVTDFEEVLANAIDVTGDAVVSVHNLQSMKSPQSIFTYDAGGFSQPGGNVDLQDPNAALEVVGSGSGVVYKKDDTHAYVVTNYHVVENADKLEVITASGEVVVAELVGQDLFTDLAVLKIATDVVNTVIEFADSDLARVGSLAIAIGSPIDLTFATSVTQGIVSGVDRLMPFDFDYDGEDDWEMNLLQTDAAINPGNSGGALVNIRGQLIGINSSKLSAAGIEGMGFAIPSNQVKEVIAELEEKGKVERPLIGISGPVYAVSELSTRSKVDVLKLPEDANEGIVVITPTEGGAAQKAGLQEYDVIHKVNGSVINNLLTLRQELYKHKVGDTVTVSILRNGEPLELSVTLEAMVE